MQFFNNICKYWTAQNCTLTLFPSCATPETPAWTRRYPCSAGGSHSALALQAVMLHTGVTSFNAYNNTYNYIKPCA